jgi:alginate O-acetyltransferase complex protein AlgI
MVFNSPVFLFLFLPVSLALHAVMPSKGRNALLLALSLFFYAWGDGASLWILVGSILFNYCLGLVIERSRTQATSKFALALAVGFNLGLLVVYKYLGFVASNLVDMGIVHSIPSSFAGLQLPMGISFFTFAAIAYQVDVYREMHRAEKSLLTFGLFLSHFAKIVAGPIVRYRSRSGDFRASPVSLEGFSEGISRFVIGLGKKVLIANPAAAFADEVFVRADSLDTPSAWLGLVCYTIQIYFDFSGYSDMAIGLGRMFGFQFMENFNYPYLSRSIQGFWRRWHISLSTWFRDYLYIPLGGNRISEARTYCNLVVVFLLCGLWHGASWNFIVWGGYHGAFLAVERAGLSRIMERAWPPLRHLYALLVIMIGWVFFRADNLTHALAYLRAMFSISYDAFDYFSMSLLNKQLLTVIVAGIVGSMPVATLWEKLRERVAAHSNGLGGSFYSRACSLCTVAFLLFVLTASAMMLATTTYNPFIYAKF